MDKSGWGERLKDRAREMGLTDSAVAVLTGLSQRRYSSYVNETREPDFRTFMSICRALRTSPDAVLGFVPHPALGATDGVEARLRSVLMIMKPGEREKALAVLEAMAGTKGTGRSRAVRKPG